MSNICCSTKWDSNIWFFNSKLLVKLLAKEPAPTQRNHKRQRSQAAGKRRRRRFDGVRAVSYTATGRGLRYGTYCSDVSGTFGRVLKPILSTKLWASGFYPNIIGCLESWRENNVAQTIVGGGASKRVRCIKKNPYTCCIGDFRTATTLESWEK